jgi:hypothetical protein
MNIDSSVARRSEISTYIAQGVTDARVVEALLREGLAISDEAAVWDFKRELPVRPTEKLNATLSAEYDAKFAEIVKDAVSFYNSYGGYLIAGIDDTTRVVVGFDKFFDAADLNKRIQGATEHSIETIFRTVSIAVGSKELSAGLLLIPKRPPQVRPAQFKKSAPKNNTGKVAYEQNDVYFRERDNCKKAVKTEEMEFLFGSRSIDLSVDMGRAIENNLPPRDIELSQFIGRDKELYKLWLWLGDAFSPVKILSGLGGVGKTSIAYTFAERLIYETQSNIDKVIWLGAKEESFSPHRGKMVPAARVDFKTIDDALKQLLLESGCPPQLISEDPSRDELMRLIVEHLSSFAYLVIVDNVDSFSDEDQQQTFHIMTQLCSMSGAKAIITARRNLGAPEPAYVQVDGLDFEDFVEFLQEKYSLLRLKPAVDKSSTIISELYEASNGSPLFALSILRLFALGDPIKDAIRNWKGFDGNDVRNAAFRREIGRLKSNEARVLLVLCYLDQASAEEMGAILGILRYDIMSALETLQGFSMTSIGSALPGGAIYEIPSTLSLVSDLVEQRVADWKEIKTKCGAYQKLSENRGQFVGDAVRRTITRLAARDYVGARETVDAALASMPDHPDLWCLRGKVFLEADDVAQAEDSFARAFGGGCRKRELFEGWLSVQERREDWRELEKIALKAEQHLNLCQYNMRRAQAIMFLGDQYSRTGENETAEQTYRASLEIIKAGLKRYSYPADRASLKKLNDILVSRWLGVIGITSSKHEGGVKRFVGACVKAIQTYRCNDVRIIEAGIDALKDWTQRVLARLKVTNTDIERALDLRNRLDQINSVIELRIKISPEKKVILSQAVATVAERLAKIITHSI